MEAVILYNTAEKILKEKNFKTEFYWAFTKGYNDTQGMHPRMVANKEKFAFDIYFDHSAKKEIEIMAGLTTKDKPTYKKIFPYTDHENFLKYLKSILEKKK